MKQLTPKQEAFCREYMIDMNATQAAIRAGYSESSAYSQGSRMLNNDDALEFIAVLAKERCEKTDLNAQMILDGILEIATNKEARDNDKLKAWELLGKYLKLFTDRHEHTSPDGSMSPSKIEIVAPKDG